MQFCLIVTPKENAERRVLRSRRGRAPVEIAPLSAGRFFVKLFDRDFPEAGNTFPLEFHSLSGEPLFRGVHQEQREASAQFFSNDVQFNTTYAGGNSAVEVTGMGKRNLLPSGLIAQLRVATPAGDALARPSGLNIILGGLVGEFMLPVNSTDIMLRSGARYNSSLPVGFHSGRVPPPLETRYSPPLAGVSVADFGSNSRMYTSVFPSVVD